MRHLEHNHRRHSRQRACKELGPINHKRRLEQIRRREINAQPALHREVLDQRGEDGDVSVQLYLAGHVDHNQVLLRERVDGFGDEVEVLEEEFETVDQAAVGAEAHFLHYVGEGDEVFDVEVGLVVEGLGGGVEVDVEGGAAVVVEVGDEGAAEGRLDG